MIHRVAAVDCGTNSLRLLLADVDPGRAELTDVIRRMEIVRLGQGVDQTGRLAPEALARTMAMLREYAAVIARSGAQAVRMVATSATRDADNATEFVRLVKEVLGVAPEVLTGDEEAVLSFTGATAELAAGPDPGPFLVADIGGGSTEFVLGEAGGRPTHTISVNIGCVRMTERHLHGDPPAGQEVAAAIADIDAALDTVAAAVSVRQARTLVGLAGPHTPVAGSAAEVAGLARGAATLGELVARQSVCRACPRLVAWREEVAVVRRRSFRDERYWGRPIPGWGSARPRLLIVGLAPAAHGGNRTGRIFTGDRGG